MKRVPRAGLAVLAVGVVAAWSTSAAAQNQTVVTQPAPPPASQPVVVQPQTAAPGYTARRPMEAETTERAVPNAGLIISGAIMLGGAYLTSTVVAADSSLDADKHLYVPLAGPWIDLGTRPGCDVRSTGCDNETTNKVLLVADGIIQAAGALQIAGGFIFPTHRVVETAGVHIAPVAGYKSAGLSALGRF